VRIICSAFWKEAVSVAETETEDAGRCVQYPAVVRLTDWSQESNPCRPPGREILKENILFDPEPPLYLF
jgi:hypothetical protein